MIYFVLRKNSLLYIFRLFTFFLVFAGSGSVFAQPGYFSGDQATFGAEAAKLLAGTNAAEVAELGRSFEATWSGTEFSEDQKKQILLAAQKMEKKKYKSRPHFENFFGMLYYASADEKLSSSELTNLLNVIDKIVDVYSGKEFQDALITFRNFFQYQAVYYANFNKLYFDGGTYSFQFIENIPEPIVVEEETKEDTTQGWFSDWDKPADDQGWNSGWETPDADVPETKEQKAETFVDVLSESPQPEVAGAIIKFEGVNLKFVTTFDSAVLQNTSGSLMVRNFIFVGEGGKFDWSVAGLSPDSVFVKLNKYNFKVTMPQLSTERAELTYIGKLIKPVEGVFEYRSKKSKSAKEATFPRFKSYSSDIPVQNIGGENFHYHGGFALNGQTIYGASVIPGHATIEVKDKEGKKFIAKSDRFNFQDTLINAERASIVLYHGQDSIYNPAVQFRYSSTQSYLTLMKDQGGYKYTPFFSTYFNIDFNADILRWDLKADSLDIDILNAKNQIPALFESQDYYDDKRFEELGGLYDFHPLLMAVGYARKINSAEFYYFDLAEAYKKNPNTMKGAMISLMQKGYIDFDGGTGLVKIKRKGYHYINSRSNRNDFDNLMIPSLAVSKPNATLNLKKQEMTIRGINRFYISELLDVYIIPEQQQITMLKNRDFRYDGKLFAGNFEFVGKDYTFKYDSFLVDLVQIDSIRFYVQETSKDGKSKIRKKIDNSLVGADSVTQALGGLATNFKGTSGTIYINKPNNKSGRRIYPDYPLFDAVRGAVVYFDRPDVLNGAYDKSMYFVIPPFKIDSLSDSNPASIGFEGTFMSGIFPDFKETLHIMPDFSLGFEHYTPEDGFKMYNSTGKYYNKIKLDKNGLRGNGELQYLTSSLKSEDFIFYNDSLTTIGTIADIKSGTLNGASFPQATVENYKMKWLPTQDSMYVSNIKEPFHFYNATASLFGTAIISNSGVFGEGRLLTRGSEAVSKELTFKENDYLARHAKFEIKSDDPKKPALAAEDVSLNFNLVENHADIKPEEEGIAAFNFPYAQFKTSITSARWDLQNKKVSMVKPEDVDLSDSYFYSTKKELDSLVFNATAAVYDIEALKLNVSGIPYITVADARITPNESKIEILQNSRIEKLTNAKLVIDTLNGYHNLFNGNIDIVSRTKFEGSATYQLVNLTKDTFAIQFERFQLVADNPNKKNPELHTVSSGTVAEQDSMVISPGMLYRGNVTMYATKPALELDGLVKLNFKTIPKYNTWIKYKSNAEQQEVLFDFDKSVTDQDKPLVAGIHYQNGSNSLYTTFITDPRTLSDEDFFKPSGLLSFDPENKQYQIVDTAKVSGSSFSGKIFTYNENTNEVRFEGPLTFIQNTPKMSIAASGKGKGNGETGEFLLNGFLAFNFDVPPRALDLMAEDVTGTVEHVGAPEAHSDRTVVLYKVADIIGERAAKDYDNKSQQDYVPLVSTSGELVKSLVISDVNFKWSEEHKAWFSVGKVSLSNILRHDINAVVDGFVEIRKTKNGDLVNVFLQVSPTCWYSFNYYENRMIAFSSNEGFNEAIHSKSNVAKAKLGDYVFAKGDIAESLTFVNRFRKTYFGIESPYQLSTPVETVVNEEEFQQLDAVEPQKEKKERVSKSKSKTDEVEEEEPLQEEPKKEEKVDQNEDLGF